MLVISSEEQTTVTLRLTLHRMSCVQVYFASALLKVFLSMGLRTIANAMNYPAGPK